MRMLSKKQKLNARDAIFLDLLAAMPTGRGALVLLAEESGVAYPTLWAWMYGETMAPRISTMVRVAAALGYTIELKRIKGFRKLKVIK